MHSPAEEKPLHCNMSYDSATQCGAIEQQHDSEQDFNSCNESYIKAADCPGLEQPRYVQTVKEEPTFHDLGPAVCDDLGQQSQSETEGEPFGCSVSNNDVTLCVTEEQMLETIEEKLYISCEMNNFECDADEQQVVSVSLKQELVKDDEFSLCNNQEQQNVPHNEVKPFISNLNVDSAMRATEEQLMPETKEETSLSCFIREFTCDIDDQQMSSETDQKPFCFVTRDESDKQISNECEGEPSVHGNSVTHTGDSEQQLQTITEQSPLICAASDNDPINDAPQQLIFYIINTNDFMPDQISCVSSAQVSTETSAQTSTVLPAQTSTMSVAQCSTGGINFRSNLPEKPFMCKICDYRASKQSYLRRHVLIHTDEKPFGCEFCEYRCSQSRYLSKHMRRHAKDKPPGGDISKNYVKCGVEEQQVSSINAEKPFNIVVSSHKTTTFCDDLGEQTNSDGMQEPAGFHISDSGATQLYPEEHQMTSITVDQPFDFVVSGQETNDVCNDQGPQISSVIKQEPVGLDISDSGASPLEPVEPKTEDLSSDISNFVFNAEEKQMSSSLKQNVHLNNFSSYVTQCDSEDKLMLIHSESKLLTEDDPLYCEALKQQLQSQELPQLFSCAVSDNDAALHDQKQSDIIDNLTTTNVIGGRDDTAVERMVYTIQKPFKCTVCDYKGAHSRYLKRHMKTHSLEKPFSCEFCDHRCSQRSHLNKHVKRMHTKQEHLNVSDKANARLGIEKQQSSSSDKSSECSRVDDMGHKVHCGEEEKTFNCADQLVAEEENRGKPFSHFGISDFKKCGIDEQSITSSKEQDPLSLPISNLAAVQCGDLGQLVHTVKIEEPFICPANNHISDQWVTETQQMEVIEDEKSSHGDVDNCSTNEHLMTSSMEQDRLSLSISKLDAVHCGDLGQLVHTVKTEEQQIEEIKMENSLRCGVRNNHCGAIEQQSETSSTDLDPLSCHISMHAAVKCDDLGQQMPIDREHKPFNCSENITNPCVTGDQQMFEIKDNIPFCGDIVDQKMPRSSEQNQFRCNVCLYSTPKKNYLKRHMKSHTGKKHFSTENCDYGNQTGNNRIRHKSLEENPFGSAIMGKCATQCGTPEQQMSLDQMAVCSGICDLASTWFDSDHVKKKCRNSHTSKTLYSCEHCDRTFSIKYHLVRHTMSHTGEKPYKCDLCSHTTAERARLKRHMRIHTGERPYTCDVCGYKCADLGTLKVHMRTHTGEKPYFCEICDYRTSNSNTLKKHLRHHSGVKHLSCYACEYRTGDGTSLKQHVLTHTGEKPYVCVVCDYKTTQNSNLKQHMYMHTGEKPFACKFCDFKASTRCSVKQHTRLHTKEKPFSCNSCDFKSSYRSALKKHVCNHKQAINFNCYHCDYTCSKRLSLKKHMHAHTHTHGGFFCPSNCMTPKSLKSQITLNHKPDKLFTCYNCEKNCLTRLSLKKHLLNHKQEKSFSCSNCDFKGSTRLSLKKHKLNHKQEESSSNNCGFKVSTRQSLKKHTLSCYHCDYTCSTRLSLKKHMLAHTRSDFFCLSNCMTPKSLKNYITLNHIPDKLFTCYNCEKNCLTRLSLKKHLLNHKQEKSFSCSDCDFKGSTRLSLKKHKLNHKQEESFSSNCDFKVSTRLSLKKHMINHKQEESFSCSNCDFKGSTRLSLKKHMANHKRAKPRSVHILPVYRCSKRLAMKRKACNTHRNNCCCLNF